MTKRDAGIILREPQTRVFTYTLFLKVIRYCLASSNFYLDISGLVGIRVRVPRPRQNVIFRCFYKIVAPNVLAATTAFTPDSNTSLAVDGFEYVPYILCCPINGSGKPFLNSIYSIF